MDERLLTLQDRVDAFFEAARAARPEAFACAPGCTTCCQGDLSIFVVEAEGVVAALEALPAEVLRAMADRTAGEACVMLAPEDGRCLVYAARPLICRSHGLAVLVDDQLDHCPLNYLDAPPDRAHVLMLDRINAPLALIDELAGHGGERVSLRELVALVQGEAE